jgi:arylsulfatase A
MSTMIRLLRSLSLGFLICFSITSVTFAAEDKKPNFIIIYCDNLGYGDIEPFGSTVHRTPNLNRMAKEGRKFTHFCVTAGVCTPSRASLMTGCYAQRVGMHWNDRDGHVLRPISPYGLNPDEITIAEVLKEAGYATTCIGKWHLGDQPPFLPTSQGFDSYFGIPYSDDMTARTWDQDNSKWPYLPLMENETVLEAPVDRDLLTKRYTERALEFIESNKDTPFFIYLPQAMPGSTRYPFASPEFRGKSDAGPWGDSIEELDWSTGQILDKLVELGLDQNTLVIWTSDNGAPASARPTDPYRGSNAPLFGRGYTTAEGAFRVPTIAWWPGTVPAGTVCDELTTTMDILPTFAKLAGTEAPSDRIIDGHDATALFLGEKDAKSPYDAFFYYYTDQLQAVRSGPWKLFIPIEDTLRHPHHPRTAEGSSKPYLFNVVTDIASEHNVADQHPDIVKTLTALAETARADLGDRNQPGLGQRPIGKVDNPTPRVPDDSGAESVAAEWSPIFNGKDLTGWECREDAWTVTDGVIKCSGTDGGKNWLIYRKSQPINFELKLKYRFLDGNSGVQVRSKDLGDFQVRGYQVEVASPEKQGLWHHSLTPVPERSHLATAGQRVTLGVTGKRTEKQMTDAKELLATINPDGEWNDLHIICQGNRLLQSINGTLFTDLADDDKTYSARKGVIALQDHGKGTQVEFKDIQLKPLR